MNTWSYDCSDDVDLNDDLTDTPRFSERRDDRVKTPAQQKVVAARWMDLQFAAQVSAA